MRIGIFGGSFDPPHVGHLMIAELARRSLDLDIVYLVPAYIPPHKSGKHASTARQRLMMTRLSIRGNPGLRVSGTEIRRKGVSYTVDTVKFFQRKHPRSELFLIIGSDSLRQFHSWKEPDEIVARAALAVYPRPHPGRSKPKVSGGKAIWIEGPKMELSSSEIRKRILRGKSIQFLVRENVRAFIEAHQLYRNPGSKT